MERERDVCNTDFVSLFVDKVVPTEDKESLSDLCYSLFMIWLVLIVNYFLLGIIAYQICIF